MDWLRWCVIGGAVLLSLGNISQGLPRLTAIDGYYRPAGEVAELRGGLFNTVLQVKEVSLNTGQSTSVVFRQGGDRTSMTGLTYSNSRNANKRYCLAVQTQFGRNSITGDVRDAPKTAGPNLCWRGGNARVVITNTGRPQVIRYRYVQARPNFNSIGTNSICDVCDEMPSFQKVSDKSGIRSAAAYSLFMAAFFGTIAFVAWAGIPTIVGHLHDIGRFVFPSKRAARVKQAFSQSKTTGETFQTETTHSYNERAESSFRQQQDTEDLQNIAREMREETARVKQAENFLRRKKEDEAKRSEKLNDEYEAAVKRVKELQEELARKENK